MISISSIYKYIHFVWHPPSNIQSNINPKLDPHIHNNKNSEFNITHVIREVLLTIYDVVSHTQNNQQFKIIKDEVRLSTQTYTHSRRARSQGLTNIQ